MSTATAEAAPDPVPDAGLLAAFWRVLAGTGWEGLTLRAVAAEAGVPLVELRRRFPGPLAFLRAHLAAVDREVIEGTVDDASSTARDRLFDVLMRRLDAMQPHRAGIARLMKDLPRDPALALWLAAQLPCAMAWMLEAAGLEATGPKGAARAHGLAAVWLAALRAWEKDDTQDLSATMAALDRALDRADRAARSLGLGRDAAPDPDTQPKPEGI
jgi:AcrR family transcriptional regulator